MDNDFELWTHTLGLDILLAIPQLRVESRILVIPILLLSEIWNFQRLATRYLHHPLYKGRAVLRMQSIVAAILDPGALAFILRITDNSSSHQLKKIEKETEYDPNPSSSEAHSNHRKFRCKRHLREQRQLRMPYDARRRRVQSVRN